MPPIYRIHPAIGIARLGNSPDGFYISPEKPAALPIECDAAGNARLSPDGKSEQTVTAFKDEEGRIKRQAARFQIYVYDDDHPQGRPLRLGEPIAGGGNQGTLVDIEWRVWVANKKASWYEFKQLEGEHGYDKDHPLRNARVKGKHARRRLIIDPGPRVVSRTGTRTARFDRDGTDLYATTFPPRLKPHSIDTLGELKTDDAGRLLVLGGHGHAGSWEYGKFGQPRIDHYANNDSWFDDTSDGPVMARLVMQSPEAEGRLRYIDVEYPAWVVAGYPAYVPEILDMVSMEEVLEDLNIRQFATRTDMYGQSGTFKNPQHVDYRNPEALDMWRAGRLQWNPAYKPWFYRDIWNILFRPDEFSYLSDILGLSNFPHNQSTRGTFDPEKLGVPPEVYWPGVKQAEDRAEAELRSGELFIRTLAPVLDVLEKQALAELKRVVDVHGGRKSAKLYRELTGKLTRGAARDLKRAVAEYVAELGKTLTAGPPARPDPRTAPDTDAGAGTTAQPGVAPAFVGAASEPGTSPEDAVGTGRHGVDAYLRAFRQAGPGDATGQPSAEAVRASADLGQARAALEVAVESVLGDQRWSEDVDRTLGGVAPESGPRAGETGGDAVRKVFLHLAAQLRIAVQEHLRKLHAGRLLEDARNKAIEDNTYDPYRAYRMFLFDLLRQPGEENRFFAGGNPDGRTHNLPLMPLLNGDNPLSNTLPSKFLRLTDTQYFMLRQWAHGHFYNEKREGWASPDPWNPYADWKNLTGRDLDRGVLTNLAGGAFCPGCEVGWLMRNPSVYHAPYRFKADPAFYQFQETAAQSNTSTGPSEGEFTSYISKPLGLRNDFDAGLQPGDVTKYMALPWQADFNECSTNVTNVTYLQWNLLYPQSDGDTGMEANEKTWESLWWPAHRPMEVFQVNGPLSPDPSVYSWEVWARGVPQTKEGDFKMVTEWWRLGFVRKNPFANPDMRGNILPPPQIPPYVNTEYTFRTGENDE